MLGRFYTISARFKRHSLVLGKTREQTDYFKTSNAVGLFVVKLPKIIIKYDEIAIYTISKKLCSNTKGIEIHVRVAYFLDVKIL